MKKSSLSERDIDRLLSGGRPAGGRGEEDLAAFLRSAREVLSLPPQETTERDHLTAMLAASRPRPAATILPSATRGRSRTRGGLGLRLRAAAAKVAIGALGLTTTTAGLAMAGVDLPGTLAEKAFGSVGISLPNQDEDGSGSPNASDTSRRVREAHERRDDSMSGCEFGASVSRAARGITDEADPDHCNRGKAKKAKKGDHAKSGRGPKKQPPGQTKEHAGGKGQDGTRGKPDTPPGQTKKAEKQEKAVTPPDRESKAGNGGTSPGEANIPEDGGTVPADDVTTSKKGSPGSTGKK